MERLPYARHSIEQDDIDAVVAALRSGWLTGGPAVERFEAVLAETVGAAHAIACSSGTAALHLAVLALGIGPGDAMVVPSVTFLATANAVRLAGAEVVFADVDPDTGLLTAETLRRALKGSAAVRAVLPVHLNGQCVEMARVAAIAEEAGLFVIEDAAHAIGSRCGGAPVGSGRFSQLTAFSLHPAKLVAMGEGGSVTTNDGELAERLRRLRSHGVTRDPKHFVQLAEGFDTDGEPHPWYYEMHEPAPNYRAGDLPCALGASQLAKLGRFVARRRELVALYDRLLAERLPEVRPLKRLPGQQPAWHLYPVFIDFTALGLARGNLMRRLSAAGIDTQVHYLPVHRQPYYRQRYGDQKLPGADAYYARVLSLPLHAGMSDADVARVVDELARTNRTGGPKRRE